jgi:hypothetical protein
MTQHVESWGRYPKVTPAMVTLWFAAVLGVLAVLILGQQLPESVAS